MDESTSLGHFLPTSEDAIIRQYEDLAYSVAHSYRHVEVPQEDLRQEALIGIVEAARHFDPNRSVKFSTYAVWWIKRRIFALIAEERKSSLNAVELTEEKQNLLVSGHLTPYQNASDDDTLSLPDSMPTNERQVIVLSYQNQLTIKEIGKVLNLSNEKVRQLRQKALRRLRTTQINHWSDLYLIQGQ